MSQPSAHARWRQEPRAHREISAKLLRFVASTLGLLAVRGHLNWPMGAQLMFTYPHDVLTYLTFGIVMAALPVVR